jgi:hypothetical protein
VDKKETPGYAVPKGCDLVLSGKCRAPKRKLTTQERKHNTFDEFKDGAIEAIMMRASWSKYPPTS